MPIYVPVTGRVDTFAHAVSLILPLDRTGPGT